MGVSIGFIVVAVLALIVALKVAKLLVKAVFIVIAVVLALAAWHSAATAAPASDGARAPLSVSV
jgi:hypothetical protein